MKDIGKTVGFKDMHPMQVSAIMNLISESIYLASMLGTEHVNDITDTADEVVKLFGGNSVTTVIIDH
jgi:hypothetical protein